MRCIHAGRVRGRACAAPATAAEAAAFIPPAHATHAPNLFVYARSLAPLSSFLHTPAAATPLACVRVRACLPFAQRLSSCVGLWCEMHGVSAFPCCLLPSSANECMGCWGGWCLLSNHRPPMPSQPLDRPIVNSPNKLWLHQAAPWVRGLSCHHTHRARSMHRIDRRDHRSIAAHDSCLCVG